MNMPKNRPEVSLNSLWPEVERKIRKMYPTSVNIKVFQGKYELGINIRWAYLSIPKKRNTEGKIILNIYAGETQESPVKEVSINPFEEFYPNRIVKEFIQIYE